MPANTATLDGILKEDYGPALRSQLNDETTLLDMFEMDDNVSWQGREHIEPVLVNRNRGAYATAEGGQPPTAGNQQVENYRIPVRFVHGQIQVTAQLMKASKNNKGAFVRGMRLEMDRLLDDLRVLRNFYIWHDGSGIRALANGNPGTGTTFTVDAPGNIAGATNGARYLNVGDRIVAVSPAAGTLRAGGTREITAINANGTVVTVDAALNAAWADNDFIVKAHGDDTAIALQDTEWNHPPMGLFGQVDNGSLVNNYFGLSRTTFPILQSTLIDSVGALSADVIQRGIDVARQLGRGMVKYHLCHPSVARAYLTVMENDRRYTQQYLMAPDAGTRYATDTAGLTFGGIPIHTDLDQPYGSWVGLDNRTCVRYVMSDGEWVDEDGSVLTRVAGQVDTFEGTYRIYDNFAKLNPNQSFRLNDIETNIVVVHRT